jgi:hypothetical protein
MNSGFLPIKRCNLKEKVAGSWSQKPGQGAVVLCRFNRILAACSIWIKIVSTGC